jgi:hypothetical protein
VELAQTVSVGLCGAVWDGDGRAEVAGSGLAVGPGVDRGADGGGVDRGIDGGGVDRRIVDRAADRGIAVAAGRQSSARVYA